MVVAYVPSSQIKGTSKCNVHTNSVAWAAPCSAVTLLI